jgi:hypothetical protein
VPYVSMQRRRRRCRLAGWTWIFWPWPTMPSFQEGRNDTSAMPTVLNLFILFKKMCSSILSIISTILLNSNLTSLNM